MMGCTPTEPCRAIGMALAKGPGITARRLHDTIPPTHTRTHTHAHTHACIHALAHEHTVYMIMKFHIDI